MYQLNEDLLAGDLENLVNHIFDVDSYKSKMGSDKDVVVLAFSLESSAAAKDLVNFLERGYDFILDADYTPGELNDGKYKVFAEIERSKHVAEQINELLSGMKKLTNIDEFKFRYYKSFSSEPATIEQMTSTIPGSTEDYEQRLNENHLNNFSNFFNRSYLESIHIDENDIVFHKRFAEPLRMKIVKYGETNDVYNSIHGKAMFENADVGEVIYLSKYIGDYNISKIGGVFVFEHGRKALLLQKA